MFSTLFGIAGGVLIVGFIVFAVWQGDKVKTKQDGPPPDRTGGYTP